MDSETASKVTSFKGDITFTNTHDAIAKPLANIDKSLEIISSSTGGADLSSWVIPAIVGALSAFFFNLIHWMIVEKKLENIKLNDSLCDVIEKLEDTSVKYWLAGSAGVSQNENRQCELSIRSYLNIMRRINKSIINQLSKKRTGRMQAEEKINKLKKFDSEIFDIITGGDFESSNRLVSVPKASKISSECTEIRAYILFS